MSYSLPEVTLKERIHPKLWLAEFHPTSAWHGKRLYTLLLSCCLSTGHERIWTLPLEIPRWFLVGNFKDIGQLWLDSRHYWLHMSGQVHMESLWNRRPNQQAYLGWTPLASLTFLRGLHPCWHHVVCLLIRCVVISVSLSSPIHQCHDFTLIWFFIIWLHFSFLSSFWHIEMLAVPLSLFSGCHFFLLQSYLLRVLIAFFLDCKRR